MSMSDCKHCWETPCACGHEYQSWSLDRIDDFIKTLQDVRKKKIPDHPVDGGLKPVKAFRITETLTGEVILETPLFSIFHAATGGGPVEGYDEVLILDDDTVIDVTNGFIDYHPDFNEKPNHLRAVCHPVHGGCLVDIHPRKDDWLKKHLEKRDF